MNDLDLRQLVPTREKKATISVLGLLQVVGTVKTTKGNNFSTGPTTSILV